MSVLREVIDASGEITPDAWAVSGDEVERWGNALHALDRLLAKIQDGRRKDNA